MFVHTMPYSSLRTVGRRIKLWEVITLKRGCALTEASDRLNLKSKHIEKGYKLTGNKITVPDTVVFHRSSKNGLLGVFAIPMLSECFSCSLS